MIRRVKIENYRCFESTIIDFKDISIIVGKNNAGKSTLVEVLRIISVVASRCTNLNYRISPDWIDMNPQYVGVSPSLTNLNISTKNLFFMYGEAPSKIITNFSNKSRIDIYLGEEAEVFALVYNQKGKLVKSKHEARNIIIRPVSILPQISPLQEEETVLKYKTVQTGSDTYLTSRHFRNQIKYNYNYFKKFQELSELSWRGLAIRDLDGRTAFEGRPLGLMVRDNSFTAEIGWMGHGLQMWLQTMWFLAKCSDDSTIILDEPDVYMHADLQRKLIRLLKGRYKQIMIATHSVEIMSEVEPENILPINSSNSKQEYASKSPMVQQIIENIGSVHNLEISRLFSHKKFLIVEGDTDDTKILGIIQDKLFVNTNDPIVTLPKTFVEGWGGWQRVIGSNKVFKDSKLDINTYCILDSDYHLVEDIALRYEEAQKHDINLHIWRRKEIENYLLIPEVIQRAINKESTELDAKLIDIQTKLNEIVAEMKLLVTDNIATEISDKDKKLATKTVNMQARGMVDAIWETKNLWLIPGKRAIKELSVWSHTNYKVNLTSFKIARSFIESEVPVEIKDVITRIETNKNFTHPNSDGKVNCLRQP